MSSCPRFQGPPGPATALGSSSPQNDIVKLLRLHDAGRLKLDELITARYTLNQVNRENRDLNDGKKHPRRHRLRLTGRYLIQWGENPPMTVTLHATEGVARCAVLAR